MDKELLRETVAKLMTPKKGIYAADESVETAGERLSRVGLLNTAESRAKMHDLFLRTRGIERYLSGVILHEETLSQNSRDGIPFIKLLIDRGITAGIKVDRGRVPLPDLPGEEVTEGLDGLRERLVHFFGVGARFAKWRATFTVGPGIPTDEAIVQNARSMALYASYAHAEGLVPIVEPEVLMEGSHTMDETGATSIRVLTAVVAELQKAKVDLPLTIVKTNMIVPGRGSPSAEPEEVARKTVDALSAALPPGLGGVVFLSGGQSAEEAAVRLNAIAKLEPFPWEVSFSYSRALEYPVLEVWAGSDENIPAAQETFLKQLRLDTLAEQGILLATEL